jgi:hypothetical protein
MYDSNSHLTDDSFDFQHLCEAQGENSRMSGKFRHFGNINKQSWAWCYDGSSVKLC